MVTSDTKRKISILLNEVKHVTYDTNIELIRSFRATSESKNIFSRLNQGQLKGDTSSIYSKWPLIQND